MTILQSAAKLVFLLMALAAVAGFLLGKLEAKDFMLLESMTFGFYFATPSTNNEISGGK